MNPSPPSEVQHPETIKRMFNAIAPTYDRLNHLLSLGLDIRWRTKAVALLAEKSGGTILDIASGSGDVSLELLKIQPGGIVASDFAQDMLDVFRQKLAARANAHCINLVSCDALYLPFRDGVFDGTIVGFGIRNFANRLVSLQEMWRVLKPDGISIVLELTNPRQPIISQFYKAYTRIAVPLLGRIISRHRSAYYYLPQSISKFPERIEFLSMMKQAGFSEMRSLSLTFGAAMIYIGRKGV